MFWIKFENNSDNKKYKVEAIYNNAVYASKLQGHLPDLYYLILWNGYSEEKNTCEPALVVLYFCKLISTFYYNYPKKPIATFLPIISITPTGRPILRPIEALNTKQKCDRPTKVNNTSKHAKKNWTPSFLSCFWACLNSR